MELLKKRGVFLYLIILIAHCTVIYMDLSVWRFYTKLLLIPILLILFLISYTGIKTGKRFFLPIIALLGAFMGDLLLAFDGAQFFLLGMIGFMITHICNSMYFYSLNKIHLKIATHAKWAMLVLSLVCSLIIFLIKENSGTFFLPIIVYMILIAIMAILSANLADSIKYNHPAVHYFIPGAILFVLSDGLLAINKFNLQDPKLDIFVMLTYGLAHLYLVMVYYKTKY